MVYRHLRLKHFAVSPRVWIPQRRIRKSSPLDHLKAAATERQFEPVCRLQMMASDLASLLGQKCITLGFQQWIQVQYRPLKTHCEDSPFFTVRFFVLSPFDDEPVGDRVCERDSPAPSGSSLNGVGCLGSFV